MSPTATIVGSTDGAADEPVVAVTATNKPVTPTATAIPALRARALITSKPPFGERSQSRRAPRRLAPNGGISARVVGWRRVYMHRGAAEGRNVAGRGPVDGLHDAVVPGAAAEVPRQTDPDLFVGRVGVRSEQRGRGDQHAVGAKAALDAELLEERSL